MRIENVTVGSDPELFIINEKTGKVVSAVGIIPGEKGNAYRADDMPEGFGLEIDNIVAEFNIPPASDELHFVQSMEYMKNYINSYVKQKNPDLGIRCVASQRVDDDQLQSEEAQLFGCMPDYNAYTESENPRPRAKDSNLRSCGCHIHVGYSNPDIDISIMLVKYMDAYLGIPSIILDEDKERRQLYGNAGAFRLTSYGVEYRTMSGFFLSSPELIRFLYQGTIRAIRALNSNYRLPNKAEVQKCVNKGDRTMAIYLCKKYNLYDVSKYERELPADLDSAYISSKITREMQKEYIRQYLVEGRISDAIKAAEALGVNLRRGNRGIYIEDPEEAHTFIRLSTE